MRRKREPGEPERVPRPDVDPIGHLEACPAQRLEEGCADCDRLFLGGFRQCSACSRWSHQGTQYERPEGRLCGPCNTRAGNPQEKGREDFSWPPAAVLPKGTAAALRRGEIPAWLREG